MINSLLIFFYNGLGDAFLALPTLRALTSLSKSTVIVTSNNDPRFQLILKDVENAKVLTIDLNETIHGKQFDVCQLSELRNDFEWFISLNEWHPKNDLFTEMCSKERCIGCFSFFNTPIFRPGGIHTTDYFFSFAQHFNSTLSLNSFLYPPKLDNQYQSTVMNFKQSISNMKLLVIHTETQSEKMWSDENWEKFISHVIISRPNYLIILIGVKIPVLNQFKDEVRVIKIEDPDFRLPWTFTALADVFIGVDSVFLHVADLYKIPAVGLFGPTDPGTWGCRVTNCFSHVSSPTNSMSELSLTKTIESFEKITP